MADGEQPLLFAPDRAEHPNRKVSRNMALTRVQRVLEGGTQPQSPLERFVKGRQRPSTQGG